MLTRDQLLAFTNLPSKELDVPAWGGPIRIRKFSGRDRYEFEQLIVTQGVSDVALSVAGIIVAAVDAEGNRLFTVDDVEALQNLSADTLIQVGREALAYNGILNPVAAAEEAGND